MVTGHPVIIEEEHELLLAAARASVAIGAYKNWVPTNFFQRVIPMLRFGGATDAQLETMLTENPRRFFEGEAPR